MLTTTLTDSYHRQLVSLAWRVKRMAESEKFPAAQIADYLQVEYARLRALYGIREASPWLPPEPSEIAFPASPGPAEPPC